MDGRGARLRRRAGTLFPHGRYAKDAAYAAILAWRNAIESDSEILLHACAVRAEPTDKRSGGPTKW